MYLFLFQVTDDGLIGVEYTSKVSAQHLVSVTHAKTLLFSTSELATKWGMALFLISQKWHFSGAPDVRMNDDDSLSIMIYTPTNKVVILLPQDRVGAVPSGLELREKYENQKSKLFLIFRFLGTNGNRWIGFPRQMGN